MFPALKRRLQAAMDASFFAEIMRNTAGKATLLGMIDAMENPQKILKELADPANATNQAGPAEPDKPPLAVVPVPLPTPHLLGITKGAGENHEPDQPGETPKRVRQEDGPSLAEREKRKGKKS